MEVKGLQHAYDVEIRTVNYEIPEDSNDENSAKVDALRFCHLIYVNMVSILNSAIKESCIEPTRPKLTEEEILDIRKMTVKDIRNQ